MIRKVRAMRHKVIVSVIIIFILGWAAYGVISWHQGSQYVTTDNAYIDAPLISVSSLAVGQIISVNVDIGDRVKRQQAVAEIGTPPFSSSSSIQGVAAPVSGYVVAVWTHPGAIVEPGSQIVTLFDDSNIWVMANIDENKIQSVRPGQEVEVTVDSLGGAVIKGKVQGISPATANFFLLPQQSSSGSFSKVAQVVPVKITLEKTDGLRLIPGSSVEVKIFTR
jgi:multidrug resistance efflux pump